MKNLLFIVLVCLLTVSTVSGNIMYEVSDDEDFLLELLETGNEQERRQALGGLRTAATEHSVPALIELLETGTASEAGDAALILGNLKDVRAVEPLMDFLDRTVRELESGNGGESIDRHAPRCAAAALARCNPQTAFDYLGGLLSAVDDPAFNSAVVTGLGLTGDDRAVPLLIDHLYTHELTYSLENPINSLLLLETPAALDALGDVCLDEELPRRPEVLSDTVLHSQSRYSPYSVWDYHLIMNKRVVCS